MRVRACVHAARVHVYIRMCVCVCEIATKCISMAMYIERVLFAYVRARVCNGAATCVPLALPVNQPLRSMPRITP